jgi:hypothetical protein
MEPQEKAQNEIMAAMAEIDKLIAKNPNFKYYFTLKNGLQSILEQVLKKWPLDQELMPQLSHMSTYVARQLDYPEPGEDEYDLWRHIAEFESCIREEKEGRP